MKPLSCSLLFMASLLWAIPQLSAQANDTILVHQPAATIEEAPKKSKTKSSEKAGKATPSYYRHHKRLSAIYSGYGIEITRSELPLKRSNPLFKQFGNIHYEKLKGGGYAYVLLVKFSSKRALKNYVKKVLLPYAPDAKALVYKNGNRK